MNYSIEEMPAFQVMAIHHTFHYPESLKQIPDFWKEFRRQGCGKIMYAQFGYRTLQKQDGSFDYAICNRCEKGKDGLYRSFNCPPREDIPQGYELKNIPAQTWLKVECTGPLPASIEEAQKAILKEWPSGFERNGDFQLEEYGYCKELKDCMNRNYQCYLWIPVRRRTLTYKIATPEDLPVILDFIRELAKYEKSENEVVATEETMKKWMFEKKVAEAQIVYDQDTPIGFALYFYNFSTWLGRAGIYIEDVYVKPEFRGRNVGHELFRRIARKAVDEGCGRIEWWCLKWNEPALNFYKSIGAVQMDEWTPLRITGEDLKKLANEAK